MRTTRPPKAGAKPTIQDVARAAGVSIATVSATLNRSAPVSPELAERVRQAVRDVDYHPNAVARSLKKGRTSTIGLIVPDITNPFFTAVLESVERTAQARGYSVMLCNSDFDLTKERKQFDLLRSRMVDGFILASLGEGQDIRHLLAERQLPLVQFDRTVTGLDTDCVLVDSEGGTREAIGHLIQLGHRRIGIVSGPAELTPSAQRLAGYAAALREAGIPYDPDLVGLSEFRRQEGQAAAHALLRRAPDVTAIFGAGNMLAIAVMLALREAGLRCPEDISVAGFDDFEWADVFHPRLTVVAQPAAEVGQEVVRLLLDRAETPGETLPPRRVVLATRLIIRDSTTMPPGRLRPPARPVAGRTPAEAGP